MEAIAELISDNNIISCKKGNIKLTDDDLLDTLKLLSELDIKIKSGKIDKGMALELFLAKV